MDPIEELRDSMDARIQLERGEMDRKLKLLRANMDKVIKVERENLEKMMKNERESMDTKLKEEREEMDRIIEMQRISTEANNMQLRMEMEAKLQARHVGIDLNLQKEVSTEQLPMDITPPAHADVTNDVEMEFRVHVGGRFSLNPIGYHGGTTGFMNFVKPAKVEWWLMVENLVHHGYKGSAMLYYLDPAREAFVFMSGPEQVDDLLHAHFGRKVCDLYIVNAEFDDDESDKDESDKDESDKAESVTDDIVIDAEDGGA